MRILDTTAGPRAMWFDQEHPCTVFLDHRIAVRPTVLADAGRLPFRAATFDLAIFDPPHDTNGATSRMARAYGHSTAAQIRDLIPAAARELARVVRPGGLLIFKWATRSRSITSTLLALSPWQPLIGHAIHRQASRNRDTYWVVLHNDSAHATLALQSKTPRNHSPRTRA